MNIKAKLEELNLTMPEVSTPGGNYVSVNTRGHFGTVAIQFPISNGKYLYKGKLGNEISTKDGYKSMQLCALNVLAQLESKIGFEKILGINHVDIYYQAGENWDDAPIVANGASDLFVNVLGEKGTHTRAITGTHQLPRNFCTGLTVSFTLL
jgi:enamine deaminase RidA (YjgF/YER057c/UK114 family)